MPVIPLYYDQIIRFTHNNISGFTVNAQNNLDLTRVKIIEFFSLNFRNINLFL